MKKMGFEVLRKSPEVAPLLVRLYDTHNVYAHAGKDAGEEARAELTSIMVDLLSVKLSERESELITDVLFVLMKRAEKDLRIALSERLASMDNVPLRMVLSLANDEISVADPVLRQSPVLQDLDLIYIIKAKQTEHWQSIASREGLSEMVINTLVDTHDFNTAINLCNNCGITLGTYAVKILGDMACNDERLAMPLLDRSEIGPELVEQIFTHVGNALKEELRGRFGKSFSAAAENAVEELQIDFTTPIERVPGATENKLVESALTAQRNGQLQVSTMVSTLRRGQAAAFIAQFAVFFGLSPESAKAVIRQKGGRNLAVACKAMDLPKADFVSLYLMTDRFRSRGRRVISHVELSAIMSGYDEIDPEAARVTLKSARN